MGLHDKHRERMRKRFKNSLGTDFEEHQLLEMLLFSAFTRADTNELAHLLIKEFGSLTAVLDARIDELMKVKGVGESSAIAIKLAQRIACNYLSQEEKGSVIFNCGDDVGRFLVPKYLGERDEIVYLLCVDGKNKLLAMDEISRGTINMSVVDIRKVVELAITKNATSIILAHNHPSGLAIPSNSDIDATDLLRDALRLINVHLHDHLIISGNDWVSMADSGFF